MRSDRFKELPTLGRPQRTLEVFTNRIADRHKWKDTDVLFYDITLKSGDLVFAPTPELLWPYKQGIINDQEYVDVFNRLTRTRFRKDPDPWYWLINQRRICLACYCTHGKFCHRHLVKGMLHKLCAREGIIFIDGGEPIW